MRIILIIFEFYLIFLVHKYDKRSEQRNDVICVCIIKREGFRYSMTAAVATWRQRWLISLTAKCFVRDWTVKFFLFSLPLTHTHQFSLLVSTDTIFFFFFATFVFWDPAGIRLSVKNRLSALQESLMKRYTINLTTKN